MGYPSKYGSKDTDAAHYIVEIMCDRKAKKEKRTLVPKFWQQDYWKPFYVQQLLAVHSLLKVYSEQAILAGINHKSIAWAYSLRAPQLQPIIADEQHKIELAKKIKEEKTDVVAEVKTELKKEEVQKPRDSTAKNTIFQKLRDL